MVGATDWDRRYASDPDPFGVGSRWYERRKQAVLVASLAQERYRLVWDCASGTGHLVRALLDADRCERLVATDASDRAVELTSTQLDGHAHAAVVRSALPAVPEMARGADLTLVPEVLYYLPDDERAEAVAALARQPGEVATVHWRHHPDDAYLSGAEVTDELHAALTATGKSQQVRHDDADFVMAGWVADRS